MCKCYALWVIHGCKRPGGDAGWWKVHKTGSGNCADACVTAWWVSLPQRHLYVCVIDYMLPLQTKTNTVFKYWNGFNISIHTQHCKHGSWYRGQFFLVGGVAYLGYEQRLTMLQSSSESKPPWRPSWKTYIHQLPGLLLSAPWIQTARIRHHTPIVWITIKTLSLHGTGKKG